MINPVAHLSHSLNLALLKLDCGNDESRFFSSRIHLIFENKLLSNDPEFFQNGMVELTKVLNGISSQNIALLANQYLDDANIQFPSKKNNSEPVPFKELLVDICLTPNYVGGLPLVIAIGNLKRIAEQHEPFHDTALQDFVIQVSAERRFVHETPLIHSKSLRRLIRNAINGSVEKIERSKFDDTINCQVQD